MKKIWAFILVAALMLSLAACGGETSDSPDTTTENGENNQTSGVLKIGDTGTAGDWEFTLTGIEFSDAVTDENNGRYYLRPADDEYKSETGNSFYTAESGDIFLFFTAELTYNGKESAEIGSQSENYIGFEIRYGDGYTFDTYEFAIADAQGADGSNLYVYDSIFEQIIVNSQKRREIAENLRLLYVALTRAKNKLIITGKILEHENLFDSVSEIDCETDLISVKQSYLNLILGSIKGREIDSLEVKIEDGSEQQIEIKTEDKFDFNLLKSAKENLKFVYPNLDRTRLSTKTSVSLVAFDGSGYENIVDSPENYQTSKHLSFSTVEEGNVVHEIMEKLNFYSENLQQEVLELIEETNNGAFDPKLLFSTIIRNVDIIKQIIPKENKIYKEKEFMIYESPLRVFGRGAEEKILIQGKIDLFSCGIKNILIDYKYTSIVDEERLVKKYSGQLRAYKFALENAINSKVDEVYLLSLKQGKLIRVNI